MAEFLTTSAKFKCSGSPAVKFQVIESSNTKVTYKNKLVLTDKVQLLGAGNCVKLAMQLGVPSAPCVCMLMPVWKGADKNKTIGRTNLLTSDAKNFCSTAGGKISVADSGVGGKFLKGSANNNYELGIRNEVKTTLTFHLSTCPPFHLKLHLSTFLTMSARLMNLNLDVKVAVKIVSSRCQEVLRNIFLSACL